MNIYITVALVIILGIIITLATWQWQLVKTIWLIATVSPYEQAGSGAGSILILGDSTGYGTGASEARASIAGRLGADYPTYSITNNSVNGRTIGELVSVAQAVTGKYDLILLQIGANDILQKRHVETVRAELQSIVDTLQDKTRHVVMLSSGNVGGAAAFSGAEAAEYEALSREFIAMYRSVAAAAPSLTYVTLFEEPENDPFVQQPDTYLAWDGLHPSDAGYANWYQRLQPILIEKLTQ